MDGVRKSKILKFEYIKNEEKLLKWNRKRFFLLIKIVYFKLKKQNSKNITHINFNVCKL